MSEEIVQTYDQWEINNENPFRQVELALDYCTRLIGELAKEIGVFLRPENLVFNHSFDQGENFFTLAIIERPLADIPIKIGVVVGLLRECLDHIICIMINHNGHAVGLQQFPFSRSEEEFRALSSRSDTPGLTDLQWALIESTHPFPGTDHHLSQLNELFNTKKRRAILTSLVNLLEISRELSSETNVELRHIDPFNYLSYGHADLFLTIKAAPISDLVIDVGLQIYEEGIGHEEVEATLLRYLKAVRSFLNHAKNINLAIPPHAFVYND